MPAGAVHPGRSIRVAWRRVFAGICVLVTVLGVASLGLAVVQRSTFDRVTSHFQAEVGAAVETSREMRDAERPIGAILYEFGTEAELASATRRFSRFDERVTAGLAAARAATTTDADQRYLDEATAAWSEVVAAVDGAPDGWGTGEVQAALATGSDPYLAVWDALSEAQASLNAFTAASVQHLEDQTHRADSQVRILLAAMLTGIAVALASVLWTGRRLTHRLISPIVALTGAARRMQAGDLAARLELDQTGGELGELAEAMNSLAASLEVSHAELQVQATTDPLTGLPNRRALQDHLDQRLVADGDRGLALLFIDLDDFKVVNDTHGHAAGDALLRVVADRLRAASRPTDLVARISGDEFAVVVEADATARPDLATTLAARILATLDEPVRLDHGTVRTGGSIGIAEVTGGARAVEEVMHDADVAMYLAKRGGKQRYAWSAPDAHVPAAGLDLEDA